jgi:hypothetical protein
MLIIRDTKEKKNYWSYSEDGFCKGTIAKSLNTGDYTIDGLESILCIERKGCISEFATNIFEDRFDREISRMLTYKYKYIILEFDMFDIITYPKNLKVPPFIKNKIRVKGAQIFDKIQEYNELGVHIILAGAHGSDVAYRIMKRVYKNEKHNINNNDNITINICIEDDDSDVLDSIVNKRKVTKTSTSKKYIKKTKK